MAHLGAHFAFRSRWQKTDDELCRHSMSFILHKAIRNDFFQSYLYLLEKIPLGKWVRGVRGETRRNWMGCRNLWDSLERHRTGGFSAKENPDQGLNAAVTFCYVWRGEDGALSGKAGLLFQDFHGPLDIVTRCSRRKLRDY